MSGQGDPCRLRWGKVMSQEPQTPVGPGPKGPQLDDMLDSLMGWNRSFIRTLKDGFLKP